MILPFYKKLYTTIFIIITCLLAFSMFFIIITRSCHSSESCLSASSTTRITPKDGMMQVYIPAGEFLMGSTSDDINMLLKEHPKYSGESFDEEIPQHRVYLDAYWIDKYEVTNAMFTKFVAETGYKTDAEKLGGGIDLDLGTRTWKMVKDANWRHPHGPTSDIIGLDNHPVVQISKNDALAYCKWSGKRLPTEAEWEKAARGTDGRIYPWGNQPPAGNLLNYADTNIYIASADLDENDGYQFTAPVGSFPDGASPYGVMDMSGNAWEKVFDWYNEKYYSNSPKSNPTGPSSGTNIIMRGGSWSSVPVKLIRTASRYRYFSENRSSGQGFRCVSSVSTNMESLTSTTQMHKSTASMIDAVVTDFDETHSLVNKDTGKHLIFGKISVSEPKENLSPELNAFLGRWEGFSFAPPVSKDWKYVLVIQEISQRRGKAYLWCGTNIQYPDWIKKINFRVINGKILSIEWDYEEKDIKKTFLFTYDANKKSLIGWQKDSTTNESSGPIELEQTQSFYVYKDYAQYLATKLIYPKFYKNKTLSDFYGQGYLVYLPDGYEDNQKKNWPLIIFLHGSGDIGDNLFLLAKASPFMMIREKGSLPFIIVAPLLGKSEFNWSFSDNYMNGVLEEIIDDYRIDRKRIYVTGLSMGGEATYRFALNNPDRFAAIAPLSAFLSSPVEDMGKIKKLPVWAIHGEKDTIIPLRVGRKPVDGLKEAGGNILFTILADHDHDVWTDTYSDPNFYEWLLQHKKP